MPRRVRLPGLVDLLLVNEPELIRAVSEDPRLDRDFIRSGPLLNRVIFGRIRNALHVRGIPLPAVAHRNHVGRAEGQVRLEQTLNAAVSSPAPAQIGWLSAYVRGEHHRHELGPRAQEAVGRLFASGYAGSAATWKAARLLDAAPRSFNPIRRLWWALTGAIGRARGRLAAPVNGDPAAVHATGIAIHNLVRSLEHMRGLWREPGAKQGLSGEAAAARCLRAPTSVLRRWSAPASTVVGEMRTGGLTLFQLEAARSRDGGTAMAFMTESWSRCPAHRWVFALLAEVWREAVRAGAAGGAATSWPATAPSAPDAPPSPAPEEVRAWTA